MKTFNIGERVSIPCSLKPGPIKGEYLITVQSVDGPVSGFVKKQFIVKFGPNAFVVGIIEGIQPETILVDIPGSFVLRIDI